MRRYIRKRRARGVTLVELMVVVAVIGVLSALFLSRVASARKEAVDGRAAGLLDLVRNAVVAYESYNATFPPDMGDAGVSGVNWDALMTTLEGAPGVGSLPRWNAVGALFFVVTNVRFVANQSGDPYSMVVLPRNGTGAIFRATPYVMYKCTGGSEGAPTGCSVIQ